MRVLAFRRFSGLRVLGVLFAVVAFHQSLAPTLLVREWYFQGAVTGVAVALGYAVGALLHRLLAVVHRQLARRTGWPETFVRPEHRRWVEIGFLVLVAVLVVAAIIQTVAQQRWTWDRLGHEPDLGAVLLLGTLGVAAAVMALLTGLYLLVRWLFRRTTWLADRLLPRWIAAGLAAVLVLYAAAFALNTWVYQRTMDGLNETFTLSDGIVQEDLEPPTSRLRSAGPDSEVVWDEMGREGRRFVTSGPSTEEIAAVHPSGAAQVEPVRVFVGREQAEDPEERAAIALDELERFGAFEREVVLVVVPTGTGWVNEQSVQPLEYLYAGDVATVSMQYSHLPSPLAFLTEAQAAQDAGEALIGAVHERLQQLPEAERPTFLVSGESLGTFGASGAFDSLDDLLADTDASLWTGPPGSVHLRTQAEKERKPGSLQIKPEWTGGDEVLFANRATDISAHQDQDVRAVFLQQADDAIVWWDWPVLWQEPDWLSEPLDPAVNPDMRWYPVTTFLNLAVDMAVATAFDEDQGHMYGTQLARAWRAMLAPTGWEGWDDAAFDRLLDTLAQIQRTV